MRNLSFWNSVWIRCRTVDRTRETPYFLIFGIPPRLPIEDLSDSKVSVCIDNRIDELRPINKLREDLKREPKSEEGKMIFKNGDLVMLFNENLRKNKINNKFKPRYKGPYKISNSRENNQYEIIDEIGKRKFVHASRLIEFHKIIRVLEGCVSRDSPNI
ncbi:hypothetical protein AYI69_g260 [Smittium culicis]|uniref:Uncharacterized protein n=1 Tax=Smittium culicis TaxID=133412 RepID=A0A1R1YTJ4_9FUNG|nr:hypothetical protein AYI69_g260 [Smittium culicis]